MDPKEEHRKAAREHRWRQQSPDYSNLSPQASASPLLTADPTPEEIDRIDVLISHHGPELIDGAHAFWMKLIQHHGFGYTLFAGKPISSGEFFGPDAAIPDDLTSDDACHNEAHFPSVIECMAWRRIRSGYPPSNHTINESPDSAEGVRLLTLVNKDAVSAAFTLHQNRFQSEFGESFTSVDLLKRFEAPNRPLDIVNTRGDLCGILFGFDTASSALFDRATELLSETQRAPDGTLRRVARSDMEPSSYYFSEQEELDDLFRMIELDSTNYAPADALVRGVQFWGITDSQRVTTLREEYRQIQKNLSDMVQNQDTFLHKVLTQYLFRGSLPCRLML